MSSNVGTVSVPSNSFVVLFTPAPMRPKTPPTVTDAPLFIAMPFGLNIQTSAPLTPLMVPSTVVAAVLPLTML